MVRVHVRLVFTVLSMPQDLSGRVLLRLFARALEMSTLYNATPALSTRTSLSRNAQFVLWDACVQATGCYLL